ncbi:monovalent cation/H+ antiporter complex subunit F [Fodinicurvata sp. EGI_FJ10296]|uniref:monovalent cation/H+ antiporter complex subunit F n=1 Tax=Fodinicurvata sp. EGI_FJ10296 TaxID=3231908 RepID=UPI0034518140
MSAFLYVVATILLLSIGVGLIRVHRGPGPGDRMLAVQLFGTTGIAILLILGIATGEEAAIDAALILGLLAAVTGLALARSGLAMQESRSETAEPGEEQP